MSSPDVLPQEDTDSEESNAQQHSGLPAAPTPMRSDEDGSDAVAIALGEDEPPASHIAHLAQAEEKGEEAEEKEAREMDDSSEDEIEDRGNLRGEMANEFETAEHKAARRRAKKERATLEREAKWNRREQRAIDVQRQFEDDVRRRHEKCRCTRNMRSCWWTLLDLPGGRVRWTFPFIMTLFTLVFSLILGPLVGTGLPCRFTRLIQLPPFPNTTDSPSSYHFFDLIPPSPSSLVISDKYSSSSSSYPPDLSSPSSLSSSSLSSPPHFSPFPSSSSSSSFHDFSWLDNPLTSGFRNVAQRYFGIPSCYFEAEEKRNGILFIEDEEDVNWFPIELFESSSDESSHSQRGAAVIRAGNKLKNNSVAVPYNEYINSTEDQIIFWVVWAVFNWVLLLVMLTGNSPWHARWWAIFGVLLCVAFLVLTTHNVATYCQRHCVNNHGERFRMPSNCSQEALNVTRDASLIQWCASVQSRFASCVEKIENSGLFDPATAWLVYVLIWMELIYALIICTLPPVCLCSRRGVRLLEKGHHWQASFVDFWRQRIAIPLRFVFATALALVMSGFIIAAVFNWTDDHLSIVEGNLKQVQARLKEFNTTSDLIDDLVQLPPAVQLGSYIGIGIAIPFFCVSVVFNLYKLREEILFMRKTGRVRDTPTNQRLQFSGATQFTGAYLYNLLFSMALVWIIITLFVILFAWAPLREALRSFWKWIVTTCVSVAICYVIRVSLLDVVVGSRKRGIRHPRCWRVLDLMLAFLGIAGGPIIAIERIGMSLLATVILLPRVDISIAPYDLRAFDWVYCYYIEALRLHHLIDRARLQPPPPSV